MHIAGLIALAKQFALRPAYFVNTSFLYVSRMGMSCARGALNVATRRFDPMHTMSWEFSAFSQNGEDGILDYLLSLVKEPTRYFVEIGASDGLENNSSFLAFGKKYRGIMVEGNAHKSRNSRRFLQALNWGVEHINMFVTPERMAELRTHAVCLDPDMFSIDINGINYYVLKAALDAGFRPKVVCAEYNSAFGPAREITVQYRPDFDYTTEHPSMLYYGMSIGALKRLMGVYGYQFVTADSSGVNAFFVDPGAIEASALSGLRNVEFAENAAQRLRCGVGWEGQFELIRDMAYMATGEVDSGRGDVSPAV